ncbi:Biotin synthase [Pontiella desulfatans]|uniref:Biotin synthase n=1 Tax=Pontiella desulfatans TaxID=2750659 RepID=A0A6C2UCS1_PONDE|nr:biotin synthase BioB [Pontiella desulfatans]VGO17026.1 Biotin synthase [Pontiella desulfatans]
MNWKALANRILDGGEPISREEALAVLNSSDDELLEVLQAAYLIRKNWFGKKVSLHVLKNAKSGVCPEDCSFCSQSKTSTAEVAEYEMQSADEIVAGAAEAMEMQALRYCVVTSSRAPSEGELKIITEAASRIKAANPQLELCASMGFLTEEKAQRLKDSGVDRFNHNLETSANFYPSICSTHQYEDRVETAKTVKKVGLDLCCGGLIGMGETLEDRVDLALALKELQADSAPINFLDPREGTELEGQERLTPNDCLRTLAMFRFVLTHAEVRIAGGRETCLRHLQPLSLYPANSMFTNGYLTTGGSGYEADKQMIEDAGFELGHLVNA